VTHRLLSALPPLGTGRPLMMKTWLGLLLVAAVATAGDSIWYGFGVRHTMLAGVLHGALLLTVVGGVLGWPSGHVVKGLPIGTLAGIAGAATYYVFVALVDRRTYGSAIPTSWVAMWLVLAAFEGRWIRSEAPRSWRNVVLRGIAAAVLGGVAFFLVLETLWGRPPAEGRNYLLQFAAWAFAWAPGLLALTAGSAAMDGHHLISARDLMSRIARGDVPPILDVRSEGEFAAGHVPNLLMKVDMPPSWMIPTVLAANSVVGLICGWLFVRRGLEAAMIAHGSAHLISAPLLFLLA